MIHVVIVEDEMLVRLGTKVCLENHGNEIRVVGSFENGEEALGYFQNHTADVLITDIRLPGISGLELIRRVRQDHMQMRLVVLSCYEDFSYAREAMELGVDRYILKHELNSDDLPAVVTELGREIRTVKSLDPYVEKSIEDVYETPEAAGYILGYLVLRGERDIQNSGREQLDLCILAELIQKLLNVWKLGECFLRYEKELFIIFRMDIMEMGGVLELEFRKKTEDFFESLSRNVYNYFNKNTYLILSDLFWDMEQIVPKFEKMKAMSELTFYFTKSRLLWAEKLKRERTQSPSLNFPVGKVFQGNWFSDSEKQIRTFFETAGRNLSDVMQVKAEVVRYFYALQKEAAGFGMGVEKSENYSSIDAFDSAVMLEEWLLQLIVGLKKKLLLSCSGQEKIEAYIREHYREEISLERISEDFHMSMPYFCQYFKKTTGTSFVTYLNRFRIEHAKELLKNPQLSAEQVALEIGITNPNYFVRLFKKVTGRTVGNYRKTLKS